MISPKFNYENENELNLENKLKLHISLAQKLSLFVFPFLLFDQLKLTISVISEYLPNSQSTYTRFC